MSLILLLSKLFMLQVRRLAKGHKKPSSIVASQKNIYRRSSKRVEKIVMEVSRYFKQCGTRLNLSQRPAADLCWFLSGWVQRACAGSDRVNTAKGWNRKKSGIVYQQLYLSLLPWKRILWCSKKTASILVSEEQMNKINNSSFSPLDLAAPSQVKIKSGREFQNLPVKG